METFVFNLCRFSQSDLHIETRVVDLKAEIDEIHCEDYRGISVVRVPVKHYFRAFTWPPSLAAYVRDADIIHVHDFRMLGTTIGMAFQRRGKPMILSTHGGFFHTPRRKFLKSVYYYTLLPVVLSRYHHIVASSATDYELVRRLHKRVIRIDNGIDFDEFASVALSTAHPPTFVYFGRFARNKRMDLLFATIRALRDQGAPCRLFLVGPESEETRGPLLGELAASGIANAVELHFNADRVALQAILSNSTYFVMASEYEGFGLAAVEAMAAGRIVLLNRIEPLSDFVEPGRSGFLIDFSRPLEAARQIREIMALDHGTKRAIAARARARAQDFSWHTKIREFKKCYDDVLA